MHRVGFEGAKDAPRRVLCLGAHSDDIEIGCGGAILKLQQTYPGIEFQWVVFTSDPERKEEAQRSAEAFLSSARSSKVIVKDWKASFLPYSSLEVKEWIEELKKTFSPDIVFTHYRHDLHQDHRTVCELTWNAFRNHFILEYEIPKYDGDLGIPNFFVELDQGLVDQKISLLLEHFQSQSNKHWFDRETFSALMRLRGMESCSRYAEAFYCRKIVLS